MDPRAKNFSSDEIRLLRTVLRKYQHILEGKDLNEAEREERKEVWTKITEDFNELAEEKRTLKTLKGKYFNMKSHPKYRQTFLQNELSSLKKEQYSPQKELNSSQTSSQNELYLTPKERFPSNREQYSSQKERYSTYKDQYSDTESEKNADPLMTDMEEIRVELALRQVEKAKLEIDFMREIHEMKKRMMEEKHALEMETYKEKHEVELSVLKSKASPPNT